MLLAFVTIVMAMLTPAHARARSAEYPTLPAATRHDRVLIVAPHIDDEAIGAAGYAVDSIANGAEVYVVFLTAGDCNRFSARLMHKTLEPTQSNFLSVGRTRIAEADAAMRRLGVRPDHFFVLGYPDRGLRLMIAHPNAVVRSEGTGRRAVPYDTALTPGAPYSFGSLMTDMRQVLMLTRPTIVIAPVAFDNHSDHAASAEIVDDAIEEMELHPLRLGYLVHSGRMATKLVATPRRPLRPPNRMKSFAWATYPLTPHVREIKTDVLMLYKSQRPYNLLLRNAFVRENELFYVYK
jgi:LmbE family N-acetylglucosaminyl deacetylase